METGESGTGESGTGERNDDNRNKLKDRGKKSEKMHNR